MRHFIPRSILTLAALLLSLTYNSLYGQGLMAPAPFSIPPAAHMPGTAGAWSPTQQQENISAPANAKDEPAKHKISSVATNYKTFTVSKKNLSAEAVAANAGYEHHPDFGLVYPGAPCTECYELIGARTET